MVMDIVFGTVAIKRWVLSDLIGWEITCKWIALFVEKEMLWWGKKIW